MIIRTDKPLRKREPNDFYPTAIEVCRVALGVLPEQLTVKPDCRPFIVDPGAGTGVWGIAAKERWNALLWGCDIRVLEQPSVYDEWHAKTNFVTSNKTPNADLVMGNPPYKFAEQFVRGAFAAVRNGGYILFLLRLAFLESQTRGNGLWKAYPPKEVYVLSARPSFINEGPKAGKTDATVYGIFVWQKGWVGKSTLDWLDWTNPTGAVTLPLFRD